MMDDLAQLLARRERLHETERLSRSLADFYRAAWPVLEPATPLCWSWHYEYLCELLELVASGEFRKQYPDKNTIIINVPPRTAKSTLVTIAFPVWTWLTRPSIRYLCASYAEKLSVDHSIKRRNLITSDWFQERFGARFSLADDRNRIDFYDNDRMGFHAAVSVGGVATGLGGEFLLGDDLLSAEDGFSEAARRATNRWITSTWATRVNDPATGIFVFVSQRLAEDDPTGYLLETQPNRCLHIKIPLEAEEDETYVFPISGRVFKRKTADVLQPERFTPSVVENLKKNSREWAGQYQQRPSPEEGGIIKVHWWRFYVRPGCRVSDACLVLPDRFDEVVQSWDMSFKDKKTSDYVCGGVWGRVGAMKYLLDIVWERMDFVETKKAVRNLSARWPQAHAKFVEDKANGTAIISELKSEISGLIPVEPLGSKEARLYAASPDVEAGNVVIPHPSIAPWCNRFIDECAAACCGGKHDDAADMLSQAINKLRQSNKVLGLVEYLKAQESTRDNKSPGTTQAARCPECDSTCVVKLNGGQQCNSCGIRFGAAPVDRGISRRQVLAGSRRLM